jgi:hypothetical protein
MENLGTNFVNNFDYNFDLTKINNKINIIVTRVRPGKSTIIENFLRTMRMDVPFIKFITISPEDDIKLTNTEDNFKSANIEDE